MFSIAAVPFCVPINSIYKVSIFVTSHCGFDLYFCISLIISDIEHFFGWPFVIHLWRNYVTF